MHLLILKLNQSQNTKNKFFWGVFSSKTKNALFRGSKMVLFKSTNFEFVLLHLFFNVKGSSTPIFTKNINIWAPWKCFENENFDALHPSPYCSCLSESDMVVVLYLLSHKYCTPPIPFGRKLYAVKQNGKGKLVNLSRKTQHFVGLSLLIIVYGQKIHSIFSLWDIACSRFPTLTTGNVIPRTRRSQWSTL